MPSPCAHRLPTSVDFASSVLVVRRGDPPWDVPRESRSGKPVRQDQRAERLAQGVEDCSSKVRDAFVGLVSDRKVRDGPAFVFARPPGFAALDEVGEGEVT